MRNAHARFTSKFTGETTITARTGLIRFVQTISVIIAILKFRYASRIIGTFKAVLIACCYGATSAGMFVGKVLTITITVT